MGTMWGVVCMRVRSLCFAAGWPVLFPLPRVFFLLCALCSARIELHFRLSVCPAIELKRI